MMPKGYVIYAPKYSKSNGVRVLYKLAETLKAKGFMAYVFAPPSDEIECDFISEITSEMRENYIVVYPEIVVGNPLQFKNVVRWVLYFSGKLGGEEKYWDYENVFTFSEIYKSDCPVLSISTLDKKLFYADDTVKDIDAYFVYKGGKWKEVPELEGLIEINADFPKTRNELANLLRRVKTLYTYDQYSLLLDEAKLCGCEVRLITKDGFSEYNPNYESFLSKIDSQIEYFIASTQKMNYKGKIQPLSFSYRCFLVAAKIKYFYYKYLSGNSDKAQKYFYKSKRMI